MLSLRMLYLVWDHEGFPCFLSKSLTVVHFTLSPWSLSHLPWGFGEGAFLCLWTFNCSSSICQKASSLSLISHFCQKGCKYLCGSISRSYVLLVSVSVPLISHCIDYCSFMYVQTMLMHIIYRFIFLVKLLPSLYNWKYFPYLILFFTWWSSLSLKCLWN